MRRAYVIAIMAVIVTSAAYCPSMLRAFEVIGDERIYLMKGD